VEKKQTTQNTAKQNNPGSVAYYELRHSAREREGMKSEVWRLHFSCISWRTWT